jgi:hypothetical protein
MKQGLNAQNSLDPRPCYYLNNSIGSISVCLVIFLIAFFLLFFTGYKKNELQDISQRNDNAGSAPRQERKISWVPFKGSFKAMDELQIATYYDPLQNDHLTVSRKEKRKRSTLDSFAEGDIFIHFPSNVTYTATFSDVNGGKIFKTVYGYVQVKNYTKVVIYLL